MMAQEENQFKYDEKRLKEDHSGEALEKLKQSFNEGYDQIADQQEESKDKRAMANLQPGSSFLELARDPADAATADWADAADAAPDAPEATDEAWGSHPKLFHASKKMVEDLKRSAETHEDVLVKREEERGEAKLAEVQQKFRDALEKDKTEWDHTVAQEQQVVQQKKAYLNAEESEMKRRGILAAPGPFSSFLEVGVPGPEALPQAGHSHRGRRAHAEVAAKRAEHSPDVKLGMKAADKLKEATGVKEKENSE